jgi:hypothetical protein
MLECRQSESPECGPSYSVGILLGSLLCKYRMTTRGIVGTSCLVAMAGSLARLTGGEAWYGTATSSQPADCPMHRIPADSLEMPKVASERSVMVGSSEEEVNDWV